MTLALSDGVTVIELPADLYWSDEFAWSSVAQTVSTTLTGASVIQVGQRQSGRPITLAPEDDSSAWMTRAALEQLQAWASSVTVSLTLTGLRGVSRPVKFRLHDSAAIDSRPVKHQADVDPGDFYVATIRLMEI